MDIWTELVTRQAALLVILLLLGAGPAALLPARFDAASRLALAPILGFCLGTCLFTTTLEFFAAQHTDWLLVPLALASAGFGLWRTMRAPRRGRPSLRDLAQLTVVCLAVAVPLNVVLHERATVGPAAYYFTDSDNYVAIQDAAQTTSLRGARAAYHTHMREGTRFANLTDQMYAVIAKIDSNLDAAPLSANVIGLLGLGATETYAPFLIVLMLMGGLGVFAAVRRLAGEPTWIAALAGAMFGGALFLELWFDGFQAALVALALIVPVVLLGLEAMSQPRPLVLALLALVLACLLTVYPLFLVPLIATAALAIGWQAIDARRRGGSAIASARGLAIPLLGVALMTLALNPVGAARTVGYAVTLVNGEIELPRPPLNLPLEGMPGWLLQTREFWYLPPLHSDVRQLVLGGLLPLLFLAFAAFGACRHRVGAALVALGATFALVALSAYTTQDSCIYCAERYLLALAPILAVLVGLGLHGLLSLPARRWKVVAIVGAVLVVGSVAQRARWELDRFSNAAFFFDSANRAALDALPADDGALHIEGYWASAFPQAEQPLVYHLANERARGRVSISLGTNAGNAIQYLNLNHVNAPGAEFRSDYRYLLTRLSGVASDRRLIVRRGAIALMERTRPLDVTPYTGLGIAAARTDGSGIPWVQDDGKLAFHVVGSDPARRVWARLTFRFSQPIVLPHGSGVLARVRGDVLRVCVPAVGGAPIRDARLALTPPAPRTVVLTGMRAVTGHCRP